ncbi:hypothetical protein SAY87_012714 [Trapa incisa]|uniref:Uncharacterized protein n=1 Tax=Trapa incisa TaxID=236973 RepID=A0AAN7GTT8_9MYRT|nr:hypothetical protein SAY87_012714 [Trapa incisa]
MGHLYVDPPIFPMRQINVLTMWDFPGLTLNSVSRLSMEADGSARASAAPGEVEIIKGTAGCSTFRFNGKLAGQSSRHGMFRLDLHVTSAISIFCSFKANMGSADSAPEAKAISV